MILSLGYKNTVIEFTKLKFFFAMMLSYQRGTLLYDFLQCFSDFLTVIDINILL